MWFGQAALFGCDPSRISVADDRRPRERYERPLP
jgi:hypothetical protein